MKKLLIIFIWGLTPAVIFSQDQPVPAWAAPSLGLPATDISAHVNPIRMEIEQLWTQAQKSSARKKLNEWMKKESQSPWPWVTNSKILYLEKRYKKSLADAQIALKKSPECGEAYYWRGKSFEAMNKLLDAANEYRAAVMAKDRFSEAQANLDRVQGMLGSSSLTTQ